METIIHQNYQEPERKKYKYRGQNLNFIDNMEKNFPSFCPVFHFIKDEIHSEGHPAVRNAMLSILFFFLESCTNLISLFINTKNSQEKFIDITPLFLGITYSCFIWVLLTFFYPYVYLFYRNFKIPRYWTLFGLISIGFLTWLTAGFSSCGSYALGAALDQIMWGNSFSMKVWTAITSIFAVLQLVFFYKSFFKVVTDHESRSLFF